MLSEELTLKIWAWWFAHLDENKKSRVGHHMLRCIIGGKKKVQKTFPIIYGHTWHLINYSFMGVAGTRDENWRPITRMLFGNLELTNQESDEILAAFYSAFDSKDVVLDKRRVKTYTPFKKLAETDR